MHLDGAFGKTLFVGEIAEVGKIDVFEGTNNEADVLGKDLRLACETGGLAGGIVGVDDLERVSL